MKFQIVFAAVIFAVASVYSATIFYFIASRFLKFLESFFEDDIKDDIEDSPES